MVDLNRPIFLLLKDIARVELEFPDAKADVPLITITEVSNIENYAVDGVEHIYDATYQIDVWDNDLERCKTLARQVSEVLTKNGFTRVLGRGFRDPSGLQRTMMYFKILGINI